jgi:chloramphenicol 3-O-phosphotransferase
MADENTPHRFSTKKMVQLAEKVMADTGKVWTAEQIMEHHDWLRDSARSLAGSVISQADPND